MQQSITIIASYFLLLYYFSFSLIDYVYVYSSVHYLFFGHFVSFLSFSFIPIPRGPEIAVNISVITLDIVVSFHHVFFVMKCSAEQKLVTMIL
jgi:hypothetical protein